MALFRQQQHHRQRGDVVLADCYYSSYGTIAGLREQGLDSVGRQPHRRTTDCRCGKRVGREEHRVEWCTPVKPAWMDQPTSAGLPEPLPVRELRVRVGRRGFRTRVFVVVTTWLDALRSSAHDVADLSGQRWHGALDLRSIKAALGMDVLRCRTPEMVRKALWMYV